jgi:hypothetical protein
MFYFIILFISSMDWSFLRNPDRKQSILGIRQMIAAEVVRLLGDRKVNELSLEEALKLKELSDLADWGQRVWEGVHSLDNYIDSLYELEAAGDFVKALKLAYKRQGKLRGDIEELKALLTESEQQIYRDREGARSRMFGIGSGLDIKKLEEGMKMMLEELIQKQAEEKHILEEEAPKLQLHIKKLKEEYVSLHIPRQDNGSSIDKVLAWGILKDRQMKSALDNHTLSQLSRRSGRFLDRLTKEMQGSPAMRWAERMHGVKLPPPAPPLSAIPASAYNTVEQKAVRNLNARESERAATLIFPSENHTRRKPTWGIPNVGPGFGGSRKAKPMRKRRRSRKN